MQKVLEDATIELATVESNIFGASGQAMIKALLETDMAPDEVANLAKGKFRTQDIGLVSASAGRAQFSVH